MLNIIYEDSYIIVIEKPPKIPSQSDKTLDFDIVSELSNYLKQQYPKARNPYIGLVHRLDRPVGGVMVFAKTKDANSHLSNQIQNHELEKCYLTVVYGVPLNNNLKLTDYILKIEKLNISKIVNKDARNSKEAILEYNVLETVKTDQFGDITLLKVKLETGRHHQIRVQLSNIGLPILGDIKYNKSAKDNLNLNRNEIALWSTSITFKHPKTNKLCIFKSIPYNRYPFSEFKLDI